jgi:starch-binding outer membrane protein, SusD/RagB family
MKNLKYFLLAGLLACTSFGCSNLEEKILDESLGGDLLTSPTAAAGLVASCYSRIRGTFNDQARIFCLQQHTTDETLGPTRGTDWDDNGIWRTLYQHNWDPQHGFIRDVFNELNAGLARTTVALNQLPTLTDGNKDLYIAEVRGLRAFFSYYMLDLFGIVPRRDPSKTPVDFTSDAEVLQGAEAVAFIAGELAAILPTLKEKGDVPYGRFNKAVAQAMLCKLHLNRGVYQDRYAATFQFAAADMDAVIANATAIISSNKYQLSTDYFAIFGKDNENNPEIILPVDLRPSNPDFGGNNRAMMTLHYNQRPRANFEPWNGFTTVADFYRKWDQTDPRFFKRNIPVGATSVKEADYAMNRGFLEGQQFGPVVEAGAFKKNAAGDLVIEALKDRPGNPLNYTVEIPINGATEPQGVRVLKFEPDPRGPEAWMGGTDIPIFRLADVYLMRAEARLRKNDNAGALADVNAVRTARGAKLLTGTLTLDMLYDERGFELYWESHRRQDMVRFGKFEAAKTHKPAVSAATRRVFSIPQQAIDANPNLRQNQGY